MPGVPDFGNGGRLRSRKVKQPGSALCELSHIRQRSGFHESVTTHCPIMRHIVIDTETTGLDPLNGDRVVEIGAVELHNSSPTGRTFHRYVCPERAMPADAVEVHGLTAKFLADKPLFGHVADEFLAFVGDTPLVAHNAGIDIVFLNAELKRAGRAPIAIERVVDSLVLARPKHPGHNTLDDLRARYGVDRSHRTQHDSQLDAELLAAVYIELTTTRQAALQLEPLARSPSIVPAVAHVRPRPLPARVTADDRAAHRALVRSLGNEAV
jgi:DNA polymerase III subunit epsilon